MLSNAQGYHEDYMSCYMHLSRNKSIHAKYLRCTLSPSYQLPIKKINLIFLNRKTVTIVEFLYPPFQFCYCI